MDSIAYFLMIFDSCMHGRPDHVVCQNSTYHQFDLGVTMLGDALDGGAEVFMIDLLAGALAV